MRIRFSNPIVRGVILSPVLIAACVFATASGQSTDDPAAPYVPTPENLAARESFQNDRFGIFIHWGVYSVLGRGEWVMNNEKMPAAEYDKLTERFNPTKFDAREWVSLFKRAGAKYMTITSKHHDGFAMFDAQTGDWDIVDRTPLGRDPLKELADECQRQGLKLFFYHSHVDWHHPEYYPRGKTGLHSARPDHGDFDKYLAYMNSQLAELLGGRYGQVGGIWFDGWWDQQTKRFDGQKDAPVKATRQEWHLRRTYDMIHRLQPTCLIGNNHHIEPFEGEDFQMFERDLPGQNKGGHSRDAVVGQLPLETCDTLNRSWGYNAGDNRFKSVRQLVQYLVRAAGNNANFLINVGPRPDGTIDAESAQRLEAIGHWMAEHEQTIRGTRGGPVEPQKWGVSTHAGDTVYLHVLDKSAADDAGWLTLTGTQHATLDNVRLAIGGGDIPTRRDATGQLEVQVDRDSDEIDLVLAGTRIGI